MFRAPTRTRGSSRTSSPTRPSAFRSPSSSGRLKPGIAARKRPRRAGTLGSSRAVPPAAGAVSESPPARTPHRKVPRNDPRLTPAGLKTPGRHRPTAAAAGSASASPEVHSARATPDPATTAPRVTARHPRGRARRLRVITRHGRARRATVHRAAPRVTARPEAAVGVAVTRLVEAVATPAAAAAAGVTGNRVSF